MTHWIRKKVLPPRALFSFSLVFLFLIAAAGAPSLGLLPEAAAHGKKKASVKKTSQKTENPTPKTKNDRKEKEEGPHNEKGNEPKH